MDQIGLNTVFSTNQTDSRNGYFRRANYAYKVI